MSSALPQRGKGHTSYTGQGNGYYYARVASTPSGGVVDELNLQITCVTS
ncbi:hypothetical protein ACWEP4_39680 [Streptomyces sp. NPDC004227]